MSTHIQKVICYGVAFLGCMLMFGSTTLSPFEIVAGVLMLITGVAVFQERVIPIPHTHVGYAFLGFGILLLVPLLYIEHPNILYYLVTLYLMGVSMLIHFWYKRYPSILSYALYGYGGAAVLSSLFGLVGYFGGIFSLQEIQEIQEIFFWDSARVSVFYVDPVVFGAFLVPPALFFSYRACVAEMRKEYLVYAALTLIIFINIILSGSRGAWLNFIFSGLIFYFLYRPLHTSKVLVKACILALCGLVLAILIIYVVPLDERSYYAITMETRHIASDEPRLEHLATVPQLISKRPLIEYLFGSGSGSYESASKGGFSAHSLYLRTLYEQGIVGAVLLGVLIALVLYRLWIMRTEKPLHAAFLLAVLSGILIHGLFVDVIHWRHLWFIIAFIV